ncbi:MAG TPA: hypothetical protein VG275_01005 [Solirubrobacteraceae bacterium]|jgi:hypothetical protein|nr:hypothetical protein [Solirubrobacteraceae bacterium]
MRQREGLIARVKQIRTAAVAGASPAGDHDDLARATNLHDLELRITHLEHQVRGLQDSVHRENVRYAGQIADLSARLEPAALAVALQKNARERGL